MLGVFAEFATKLRRECPMDGVAKAKADGVYKGCKPFIDPARIQRSCPRSWVPPRSHDGSLSVSLGLSQPAAALLAFEIFIARFSLFEKAIRMPLARNLDLRPTTAAAAL
jgi:hypothetical protein